MSEVWKVTCQDGQSREIDPVAGRDLTLSFMEQSFTEMMKSMDLPQDADPEDLPEAQRAYITGYLHGLRDLAQLYDEIIEYDPDEGEPDAA